MNGDTSPRPASHLIVILLAFVLGLASSRLLYEGLFPRWPWLGRPLGALPLALAAAITGWWLWSRSGLAGRVWHHSSVSLWPLSLNLVYLFDPVINLVRSRFVFAASIWMVGLLLINRNTRPRSWSWWGGLVVVSALLPIYLITMPATVGRADSFEFQVVTPQLGIAHPTGYPLYLLLGKMFTLVPAGTVAWRLNLASVVYALLAAIFVYLIAYRLLEHPIAAVIGAVVLGMTPTFWSQAIEAEVYALHAMFVSLALLLLTIIDDKRTWPDPQRWFYFLALVVGFGLSNHLTTLFLLPPAALMFLFKLLGGQPVAKSLSRWLPRVALVFLLPLLLYAYLPIRWAAVNGEPMGFRRFVDWVIGGRFQGALQWGAWLDDFTHYEVVGRLFMENWSSLYLLIALGGLIYLFCRKRRMALVLLTTWLGYTFYALNYYVPDLAVFLIPSQLVIAVFWAAGLTAILEFIAWGLRPELLGRWLHSAPTSTLSLLTLAVTFPVVLATTDLWPHIDRSLDDGLTEWGQGVLNMPLEYQAAILADSEKIAPLYYLQQAEGMRPDLEIMVLPDESAYRAELDSRLARGQTVYLARFLPGLEGIYHLRAVGPLTEVSNKAMTTLPDGAIPIDLNFHGIRLLGYQLESNAAIDASQSAVIFFWQANHPIEEILYVHVRWKPAPGLPGMVTTIGQHPANNYYPTVAWRPNEIVPDFHLLGRPMNSAIRAATLEVGLAPPFAAPEQITWQEVTQVNLPEEWVNQALEQPLRAQMGDLLLSGSELPAQVRPQTDLLVTFGGYGAADTLQLHLRPAGPMFGQAWRRWIGRPPTPPVQPAPFVRSLQLAADVANGSYQVIASQAQGDALCGWLFYADDGCVLGEVLVSGVPLPPGATNFEDKIALLSIETAETELRPGGQLHVNLIWQGLASLAEDYTVFIQVLNAQDRLVGQIDAWPRQGTYPTSQWAVGETVTDPYVVQLDDPLPAGSYRLQVGWYLLGTLRRLPVLDEQGLPIDDKVVIPGLIVP